MSPLRLYYREGALALQSEGCPYNMEADGWIKTERLLPANIPYNCFGLWLRNEGASLPILASS